MKNQKLISTENYWWNLHVVSTWNLHQLGLNSRPNLWKSMGEWWSDYGALKKNKGKPFGIFDSEIIWAAFPSTSEFNCFPTRITSELPFLLAFNCQLCLPKQEKRVTQYPWQWPRCCTMSVCRSLSKNYPLPIKHGMLENSPSIIFPETSMDDLPICSSRCFHTLLLNYSRNF